MPDVGAGVRRCLIKPKSGDRSAGVGAELHAKFNGLAIVTVDQRRLHGFVQQRDLATGRRHKLQAANQCEKKRTAPSAEPGESDPRPRTRSNAP